MTKHTLKADNRSISGRSVKKLRTQGLIPANVFGKKITSANLQVNVRDFQSVFKEAGESTLVYLSVTGEKEERPVLIREVVTNPVSGQLLHVSFHQVDLKEKVTAPVSIELSGEAQAEKDKLGILVQQLDEVEIEALPTDMPEQVVLDVSGLTEVGASLTVADIKVDPAKITIKTDPETIIAKIEPLAAEEPEPAAAPPSEEASQEETSETPGEGESTPAPEPKEDSK